MSIPNKITTWLAASGLFLIASFTSSGANAVTWDAITPASVPQFLNNVKVRANNGTWTLSTNDGNKAFTFNDGTTIWDGKGFKYNFTATFDKQTGDFLDGSVSIQGAIAGLGITNNKTVLMSADLTAFGWDGANLVGFNTANILCDAGLGVNCTPAESVIIALDSLFGGDPTAKFSTTGTAITSVPLPAAIWLFGSGLGLMGVIAKRNKKIVNDA